MDKKKIFIIAGIALAVLVVIVFIISKLSSGTPEPIPTEVLGGDPNLPVSIELGKTVDETGLIDKTDIFLVSDPEIHTAVYYRNLPTGSLVDYQWYNFRSGTNIKKTVKVGDRTTAPSTSKTPDTKEALVRGEKNIDWSPGEYAFRVAVDTLQKDATTGKVTLKEQKIYERRFSVVTPTEYDNIRARNGFKSFELTSSVDINGVPTNTPSDRFTPKTQNVYAVVNYMDIPKEVHFEARWVYLPTGRQVSYFDKYVSGRGTILFNINAVRDVWTPVKEWPTGEYELRISVNNLPFDNIKLNGSENPISKIIFKIE